MPRHNPTNRAYPMSENLAAMGTENRNESSSWQYVGCNRPTGGGVEDGDPRSSRDGNGDCLAGCSSSWYTQGI